MKKYQIHLITSLIIILVAINIVNGQVAISINSTKNTPDESTILDMDFDENKTLGILIPRVDLKNYSDSTTITDPADYLLIFSTNDDTNGVNLWNTSISAWDNVITNAKLTETINSTDIPQVVLSANQSTAETTNHVTDSNNSTPYKIKMNSVDLDSKNGYDTTNYAYTIQTDGIYEITCNTTITSTSTSSSQTYIGINGTYSINTLLASTTASELNPNDITTVDSYTAGTVITCAVGYGSWNSNTFKVSKGSIKIVKY